MVVDLLSLALTSVSGSDISRVCKICYDEDQPDARIRWLHPCRCSGTLYWVHENCFGSWMRQAPLGQQFQCQICKYAYKKVWVLKSFSDWCWPSLNLTRWDCVEIMLDVFSTYKFIKGFVMMLEGKRTVFWQCLHLLFWRGFVATNRRLSYYYSLNRQIFMSIFDVRTKNYIPGNDNDAEEEVEKYEQPDRNIDVRFEIGVDPINVE
ncbi:hypothetical protein WR25_16029 [Diploscapter pachys]|uniref:RING-CH-type domain-containing protein n=1 Tax=Diploscapter pachys TaxID=2018661 RepID=A0A2A2JAR0_9BILA|nr:hypothetical protein WR25_16029 [Diploscapter pachys]